MNLITSFLLIKSDWITVVFILIFLVLGAAKYLYKERLSDLIRSFFSKKYILQFSKESQLIFSNFNLLLFVVKILSFSLFIYFFMVFYFPNKVPDGSIVYYLKTIGGLSLFFLIRYFIGTILGIIFNINKMQAQLAFTKMIYLFTVSVLILPFLLLTFYMKSSNLLFFQLSVVILLILLIVRYVFVFRNNKSVINRGMFYFILYLCALEIAPILLVLKIIN